VPKPLDLTEFAQAAQAQSPPPAPEPTPAPAPQRGPQEEEIFDILYIRCPRSLSRKLRRRVFELSEQSPRRKISQTDLVVQALRRYLEESDGTSRTGPG
jgi:hypothetical protein